MNKMQIFWFFVKFLWAAKETTWSMATTTRADQGNGPNITTCELCSSIEGALCPRLQEKMWLELCSISEDFVAQAPLVTASYRDLDEEKIKSKTFTQWVQFQ